MPHRKLSRAVLPAIGTARRSLWAFLFYCLTMVSIGRSAEQQFDETELKAAYLYNFAYFVTWPDTSRDFIFCTYANSPVSATLARLIEGEHLHDQPLRILIDPLPNQLRDCRVIYIPAQQERVLASTLEFVRSLPILTVSDVADFEQRGGMVRLASEERRILPVIQLKNVTRTGLTVSSKLLRSSRIVE